MHGRRSDVPPRQEIIALEFRNNKLIAFWKGVRSKDIF
jgi:hypothetical protein